MYPSAALEAGALEEVLEISARRKALVSRMREACLHDNIVELKLVAEIYCGLREDDLS